jgi:cell division protein FtsA
VGTAPSPGIKRGVVVDREATIEAIQRSVTEARNMAARPIRGAYVGITGDHIESVNVTGRVHTGPSGEVKQDDIDKVILAARDSVTLPTEREIVYAIVRDYTVDGQAGVKRPLGMTGNRLDASVHVVQGMSTVIENLERCVKDAGFEVQARVLEPIATSAAVVTEAERDLGVILIDIGGGTTDIAVFSEGAICHTSALPIAGTHCTRDLAQVMRISVDDAEFIKLKFGRAIAEGASESEVIQITLVGQEQTQKVPQKLVAEIIQPRLEEIFTQVRDQVRRAGVYDLVSGGIVISGGGSQLPGTAKVATQVMGGLPARVGNPRGLSGLSDHVRSPSHATGVGLALIAAAENADAGLTQEEEAPPGVMRYLKSLWDKISPRLYPNA